MVEVQHLTYNYKKGNPISFPSFTVKKGETLLILGKSGVGKTTLLHLLGLILKPQYGVLTINNIEINTLINKHLGDFRAKNIGVIYQKPHFIAALNVKENLLLANYLAHKKLAESHLNELANSLGFADLLSKKTTQLSLGEQQRVGIARALMNNPLLILADEPTSSLDDENCEAVIQLLKEQSKKIGACLIIVTHDQRLKKVFPNQITLN